MVVRTAYNRMNATAKLAPRQRPEGLRLSVGFILAKRFTLCAFANFVDVLRLAADEGDRSRPIMCGWTVLSDTMNAVPSSSGIAVQPNQRLGDPTKFDYIVVIGGVMDDMSGLGAEYTAYLQRAAAAGVPLVGVCTGGFLLHKAGLMKGYRCCVSWFHHADFLQQFDGLVEKHVGRAQASKSLHIMIIDDALQPEQPQPGVPMGISTRDPMVMRALLLMQQNIDNPLSVSELSRRMGNSKRQLERHFRAALGASPQAAFLQIRLTFARHLLETTDKSVAVIAVECGFCDSSHLSRLFRQRFDCTPQEVRKKQLTVEEQLEAA
jgi:transcriptional regulator GlxA family with amidase domain